MKTNGHATAHLVAKVYANPRYRGKWVIVVHGRVFPQPRGRAGFRLLSSLVKRYPAETPTLVYVPKAETLIL